MPARLVDEAISASIMRLDRSRQVASASLRLKPFRQASVGQQSRLHAKKKFRAFRVDEHLRCSHGANCHMEIYFAVRCFELSQKCFSHHAVEALIKTIFVHRLTSAAPSDHSKLSFHFTKVFSIARRSPTARCPIAASYFYVYSNACSGRTFLTRETIKNSTRCWSDSWKLRELNRNLFCAELCSVRNQSLLFAAQLQDEKLQQ
jgi:hypothetical protein